MDTGWVCIWSCGGQGLTQPPKPKNIFVLGKAALPRYLGSISAEIISADLLARAQQQLWDSACVSFLKGERTALRSARRNHSWPGCEAPLQKNHHGIIQSPDQDLISHPPGRNLPLHETVQTFACSRDALLEKQPLAITAAPSVPPEEQVTAGLAGADLGLEELEAVQGCPRDRITESQSPLQLLHPHTCWHFPPRCAKPLKFKRGFKIQQVEASTGGRCFGPVELITKRGGNHMWNQKLPPFFFFFLSLFQ